MKIRTTLPILALVATGCMLGPDYERPELPVEEGFRGQPDESELADEVSLGDREWFQVLGDPVLQELVETALRQNQDVRIAAERVLQARSFVTVTNADLYPEVNGGMQFRRERVTENAAVEVPPGVDPTDNLWSLFADLGWDLDFWGRFRRASEAARADLVQAQYARRLVIQTLVTDLALSYFDLLLLDAQLEITKRTYESRQKSLELVSLRLDEGVANKLEFRQAEGLVLESAGLIPGFESAIEVQENQIRFLLGENPHAIPRGRPLLDQERDFEVPLGLPSELLARRPDVAAAEQGLVAANARIGEAKALLYPSIRLTGLGGFASEDLDDLVEGDSRIWDLTPSVRLPIFNAGRLRSNVEITESQQREATIFYVQTLQNAFREVADALVESRGRREIRGWREKRDFVLNDQAELSHDRYRGGVTDYLEVLDTERDHFEAQIDLALAIRDELFAYVLLYRSLGGGWQGAEEIAADGPQLAASDEAETEGLGGQ